MRLRILLHFCLLLGLATPLFGQTIRGTLLDGQSKKPLAYATVFHPASGRGALTNADGKFELKRLQVADSLSISYVGYRTRTVPVRHFSQFDTLLLQPTSYELAGATVYANDDYLYDLVSQAGRLLDDLNPQTAKSYFQVITTSGSGQPLEMVQAYYNATTNKRGLVDLKLKGGRIALAPLSDLYFATLSTAQALGMLDLRHNEYLFPGNPLQYGRAALEQKFTFTRRADFSNQDLLHLGFEPTTPNGKDFGGEVWIDGNTYLVHRIILRQEDVQLHPFLPAWKATEVKRIDLDLDFHFTPVAGVARLSHINVQYAANLTHAINTKPGSQILNMEGILHCYDYGDTFFIPLFRYNANHNDYRKISFLPFNQRLWDDQQGLVFTPRQEQQMDFFYRDGWHINFDQHARDSSFYPDNNYYWDAKDRIYLPKAADAMGQDRQGTGGLFSKPDPVVKFFLDVNPTPDSLSFTSRTVLDVFQSSINLPKDQFSDCLLNIFFDLCELERRKMMHAIRASDQQTNTIRQLHAQAEKAVLRLKKSYFRKVKKGTDFAALAPYNKQVKEALGINNLALFHDL
ncbi:MAG: carboxypeptidase-like regulatory domain-containing protein [Bacteroidota bacterium]